MTNPLLVEDTMPALIFSLLRCEVCKIRYAVFRRDDQFYYYDSRYVQNSIPLYVVATSDPLICPAPHGEPTKLIIIGAAVLTSDGSWINLEGAGAMGYG